MEKKRRIGIDVGGTKIHLALIEDEKVIKEIRLATNAQGTQEEVLKKIESGISELMDNSVEGIGIGVPGLVETKLGIVFNVANIPAWKNVPIKEKLEKIFKIPVFVGNDANCFALGEKFCGKGKPFSNVIGLSLGTGVGAGVIVNDKLHIGNHSIAGEFGGIRYMDADYESYCSGKFFTRQYNTDALTFSKLAEEGNEEALTAFAKFGMHLAQLIETIMLSYGPDAIILGGSLSKSYRFFADSLKSELKDFPHQKVVESTQILVSDNSAIPVLGAAELVNQK